MSEATEQVPSAETIRELQQALRELLIGQRNTATVVHEHEEEVLPRFVRLTDIANTISPQLSSITGWPPKVMRSLRAVIEGLHALTLDWGWEKIGLGEPFRTQHIEERKAWFRENVERPMYVLSLIHI